MKITVFCFRGTGEPTGTDGKPWGMLANLCEYLPENDFQGVQVDYPAQIAFVGEAGIKGVSLDESVRIAVENGIKLMRDTPGPCVAAGYSLGGICTSVLASQLPDGIDLRAVVNVANPARRRGEAIGTIVDPHEYGLHGERAPARKDIPFLEVANPADMITSADPLSPIRRINDGISPFSLIARGKIGDINNQLRANRTHEARWQFWNPAFWERYARAIEDVRGYLAQYPNNQHTMYSNRDIHYPGTTMSWNEVGARALLEELG